MNEQEIEEFRDACRQIFKKFYPEPNIRIMSINILGEKSIVHARFTNDNYFFIVTPDSVSASYNNFNDAKQNILNI